MKLLYGVPSDVKQHILYVYTCINKRVFPYEKQNLHKLLTFSILHPFSYMRLISKRETI